MNDACKISETILASGHRAVILENSSISVTLLPEKGAEIHSLVYKPSAMDVLWKSPWGSRREAPALHLAAATPKRHGWISR